MRIGRNRSDAALAVAIIAASALPFLLSPLRARLLGPLGRGEFAYFQSVLTITGAFAASGLRLAFYDSGLSAERRFALSLRRPIAAPFAVCVVIIATGAIVAVARLDAWPVAIALCICLLLAPGYSLLQVELAAAQRAERRRVVLGASTTPAVTEFVLNGVLFATRAFSVSTAMAATFVAELGRVLVGLVSRSSGRSRERVPIDPALSDSFRRNSFRYAALTIVPALCTNVDTFIWGAFLPTAAIGLYSVSKMGYSVFLMLGAITEGRALRSFNERGPRGYLVSIAVPAAIACAAASVAGLLLVPLIFGSDFTASAIAFPIASVGGLLAFFFVSLSAIAASRGHRRVAHRAPFLLLGTVVGVSFLIALLRTDDVVLMTAALAGAQAVGVGALALLIRHEHRYPSAELRSSAPDAVPEPAEVDA